MDARDGRVDRHLVSMVAASDTLIQYRKALDAHTARGGAVNPNEIRKSEDIWKVLSALVAGHITRDEAIAHYRILQLVHALPAPSPANARRMRRRLTRRVLNTYLRPTVRHVCSPVAESGSGGGPASIAVARTHSWPAVER
jgi:hypothetical protein